MSSPSTNTTSAAPCTLCNTKPANLTGPDMPANNATHRRNTIARQDRLEHEACTQALARREVGLTGHDHRHNAASGSHAPHYHHRSSSPLPCVGYPYTCTWRATGTPALPRPGLGATPKGKPLVNARWRSSGSSPSAVAHPHSPSES